MRLVRLLTLYMALVLGANAALALDATEFKRLAHGDMRKLNFAQKVEPVSDKPFQLEDDGGQATLADWRGKWVLLNFWATWCAPCRKEMPTLAALQAEFGGADFEVLTLATGRNNAGAMKKFFADIGVDNLPRHQDPKMAVARDMTVVGLPVTVLIDPEGNEFARLIGDADWHSDSARAIFARLLGRPAGE